MNSLPSIRPSQVPRSIGGRGTARIWGGPETQNTPREAHALGRHVGVRQLGLLLLLGVALRAVRGARDVPVAAAHRVRRVPEGPADRQEPRALRARAAQAEAAAGREDGLPQCVLPALRAQPAGAGRRVVRARAHDAAAQGRLGDQVVRPVRHPGHRRRRLGARDQARLPQDEPALPPGQEPGRRRGRAEVHARGQGLRGPHGRGGQGQLREVRQPGRPPGAAAVHRPAHLPAGPGQPQLGALPLPDHPRP
ncbi:hypothetical protein ON010_g16 [Phytophthora cinnamomi]|nr:hypothetical protein ON010_g16 [Phytophthora cinnamomi]